MTIVPIYRFITLSLLFGRAHAHLGIIGGINLAIIGFVYIVLDYLNKPMYSEKLGHMGFSLLNIGIVAEYIVLVVGGYRQARSYIDGDTNAYMTTIPYTMLTIIFAFVMLIGVYTTIYNIYKTVGKM
jgi:heme/copper-type cytochrome/quinol oxidase subunit 1